MFAKYLFAQKKLDLYFLRLGTTGFGGPIALVGYMQKDLVEERRWLTMVVLLGMLYVAYGGPHWMQAIFYGVGAAVIGIIVKSAYRLTKVTLKNRPLLWAIFSVMCFVTAFTQQEIVWLFLWRVFLFFAKAGSFVFGSGLAIVPFLYGGTVQQFHWLSERQLLDAVAVAMITPGPVVITVGFI